MITNYDEYRNIVIRNGNWFADVSANITNADLSLAVGQVNELSITVDDPGFAFIKKHPIPLKTRVDYQKLQFSVASLSLEEGDGEGGFALACRPHPVRRLKETKGKKSLSKVSPSMWVKDECSRLGIKCVTQPSSVRTAITRDVTEPGQQGTNEANAWTTFNRLATEIGFLCFELEGAIYFGQPTWFVKNMRQARVTYRSPSSGYEMNGLPKADVSLDNDGRKSISFAVPLERQAEFRPGRGVSVSGVPGFGGTYFITSVDFPLAGPGEVSVSAVTPHNPKPGE